MRVILSIVTAILVRLALFIHCFIATWRVVESYNDSIYWWMLVLLLGIVLETVVTLWKRSGEEWEWFSPSIFFYLAAVLPCIWLLELKLMEQRADEIVRVNNVTETGSINNILGINITIDLDDFGWALAIEQTLFSLLIFGRWILPRGYVTRDQLSQILLVYIGMAADIMELFEVFEEKKFVQSQYLVYPTLSLWTWSLLQYCIVITSTKARKTRFGGIEDDPANNQIFRKLTCPCNMPNFNADVFGILTTLLMQDVPFVIFRIYILAGLGIISHMMVFFTCKNALVILLQIYRLIIIYIGPENGSDDTESVNESGIHPVENDVESISSKMKFGTNRVSPESLGENSHFDQENLPKEENATNGHIPQYTQSNTSDEGDSLNRRPSKQYGGVE